MACVWEAKRHLYKLKRLIPLYNKINEERIPKKTKKCNSQVVHAQQQSQKARYISCFE